MVRVLILIAAVFLAFAVPAASAAEAPDPYRLRTGIDVSYINTSRYPSWTEGLVGKLRYDDNNEGLMISRAFADYEIQLADTLKAHAAVEADDDDIESTVDFTEAYVEWRPVVLIRVAENIGSAQHHRQPAFETCVVIAPQAISRA